MICLIRPECPNPEALVRKDYKHPLNKEALRKSTSGKCMYCESRMEHNSFSHVEHIKPKSKFPELEFVWDNLGFSCEWCNINKSEKYDEAKPFINPYIENPEDHIVFIDHFACPKDGSIRGEYTKNELKLNRSGLVDDRKNRIEDIKKMINAASNVFNESLRNQMIEELKTEAESDKEYSAMVKNILIAKGILKL